MSTTRRTLLKAAGAAAVLSGTGVALAPSAYAASHPGMLHTQADFDRMRAQVNAGAQPWKAGWDRLVANSHSQSSWRPNPQQTIIRGGTGQNYGILYNDIAAAYQNALRWRISGSTAHGNTARDILNAWSGRLTTLTGNADRFLAAGIYGYEFCNAAEIMRGYSGFDLARFQRMMLNVFYPLSDDFLNRHNGACITNYWANWDLCNMCNILAIGILNDDQAKFDRAINYFKTGAGNGSIMHAIPFLHENGTLGQWQESGRDQGHTVMGIGLMGTFCEMAWNQGQDMYGYADNRFLKACEYVARYNLGESVPFTTYRWGSGVNCTPSQHTAISSHSRGQNRPVWELVYNHYVNRRRLSAPYTARFAARVRPEGGGGDYGSTSGGYDHLGFGTLTATRSASGGGLVSGATYKIRNVARGQYVDSDANGVVIVAAASPYDDQDWVATQHSSGAWTFRNARTGRFYLDTEPNNVVIWNDGYIGPDSQWRLESTSGGFRLKNDRPDRSYMYGTSGGEVRWNIGSTDASTVWAFERR